ncbi:ABC transporter permease [Zafaria sp. Z1313]|uniref:ABC transporter permease n=1 Tax=Zafaria sp. Z1313 TaxID=3423202 RepID=UPI003D301BD5
MSTVAATSGRHRSAGPAGDGPLAGAGLLLRAMARRERFRVPAWALLLAGLTAYIAVAVPAVYSEPGALEARGWIMREPAAALLAGPGFGLEHYTVPVMLANEMLGLTIVAVAVMSLQLVVRHTRAEEEAGRTELLRAAPVGRAAPAASGVVLLTGANALIGATMAAALAGLGFGLADSIAYGAALAAGGMVFGAVAAVTAQLTESARTAAGTAGAVLLAAYVLRGLGDAQQAGGGPLSWASPIGWLQQSRVYVELRWWPLLLTLGLAVVLLAAAHALSVRRDLGAGLLPARRGRTRATVFGRTLPGLALRGERWRILWWLVAVSVLAVLCGALAEAVVEEFRVQPDLLRLLGEEGGQDLVRQTMALFLKFFAMAVAVYAGTAAHALRADEDAGRTELLLAGAVRRPSVQAAPLVLSVLASGVLLLAAGAGLGAGAASVLGPGAATEMAAAALAYWPLAACWTAAALLLHALSRSGLWLWVPLGTAMLVGLYGPLMDLPPAVLDAEPFGAMGVDGFGTAGTAVLGAGVVAVVLAAAALAAFRRRDVPAELGGTR